MDFVCIKLSLEVVLEEGLFVKEGDVADVASHFDLILPNNLCVEVADFLAVGDLLLGIEVDCSVVNS